MRGHFATRGRITHRLMRLERNGRRASLFAFGLRPKIPLRSVHQKNARTMTLANWSLLSNPGSQMQARGQVTCRLGTGQKRGKSQEILSDWCRAIQKGSPTSVSAIDDQIASGEKAARIRSKKKHRRRNLLRLAHTSRRREFKPAIVPLLIRHSPLRHRRIHVSRRDTIYPDPAVCPFARKRFRQHDHGRFGCVVSRLWLRCVEISPDMEAVLMMLPCPCASITFPNSRHP